MENKVASSTHGIVVKVEFQGRKEMMLDQDDEARDFIYLYGERSRGECDAIK